MIGRVFKIIALFLAFGVTTALFTYLTLKFVTQSEDTVETPDVVGKEVVSALKTLSDLELNTKVRHFEYSATTPANHVIFQEPEPGAIIKKGRDVRLVISKGAQTIPTPNLINLALRRALIIMETNDLDAGVQAHTFHPEVEKDHIIAQTPFPNATIQRSAKVDLLISLGKRPRAYMMPNLRMQRVSDAVMAIEQSNLKLGKIKLEKAENAPPDVVIGQAPQAGHRILSSQVVDLVVNGTHSNTLMQDWQRPQGVALVRHRLANGFLNHRIRVRLNGFGAPIDVIDDFYRPGEEIWVLAPRNCNVTVLLYEDENLIETRLID